MTVKADKSVGGRAKRAKLLITINSFNPYENLPLSTVLVRDRAISTERDRKSNLFNEIED